MKGQREKVSHDSVPEVIRSSFIVQSNNLAGGLTLIRILKRNVIVGMN